MRSVVGFPTPPGVIIKERKTSSTRKERLWQRETITMREINREVIASSGKWPLLQPALPGIKSDKMSRGAKWAKKSACLPRKKGRRWEAEEVSIGLSKSSKMMVM